MKLQVNNSGAWKNVLVFNVADMDMVQTAVNVLGVAAAEADYKVSWRIVDARDLVTHHWTADADADTQWKPTRHAAEMLP